MRERMVAEAGAEDRFTGGGAEANGSRVAAREKGEALGPCELRALLRDAPSSVHARGMAEGASPGTARFCDPTTPVMLGR